MSKTFTPKGDNILVEPLAPAQRRGIGIIDPDVQKDKPTRGAIISIGPKVKDEDFVPGVEVEWRKYSGHEKRIGGKDYWLLREDEIEGTWNEEDDE